MHSSESQRVTCLLGGGQGKEGHHVDLGIPEVMTFIAVAGETFRWHAGAVGSGRRLSELEDAPSHCLLDSGFGAAHLDVAAPPEIGQPFALLVVMKLQAAVPDPVQSPPDAIAEFAYRNAA